MSCHSSEAAEEGGIPATLAGSVLNLPQENRMNAISVVCVAFLGLGLLGTNLQQPQGKEPQAAVILPGLADALKGYVGQDCWVNWAAPIAIFMNDQKSPAKYKIGSFHGRKP
jgi:hypothetical protein